MIFKQIHQESLGHASYLVSSEQTSKALVLDVRRDVGDDFARAKTRFTNRVCCRHASAQ